MRSIAYVMGNRSQLLKGDDWHVMVCALGYFKKMKGGEPMPEMPEAPRFWLAGTDKEAIKKELCRRVDAIFELMEQEKP